MYITAEMKAALDKKQSHRDNGDQFKYRLFYDPTSYFFKYKIQEFRYVESEPYVGRPLHKKGWKTLRQFASEGKARAVVDELERINGYLAKKPSWYKEEFEQ
ncbi:hypothetical protein CL97_gp239 [Cronobacter phage CR9]|uniref:Uncharacterized protein n=1 Tax=Cronobacter phage CR9 TaxID=1162290 RepID=M1EZI1_9CAUD|nr:hypothetical protein CL97_gp239 [Cronobacter phage CR9]AFH21123.1 hypothetical protein CR9_239 [Cronobacter phage CR9]